MASAFLHRAGVLTRLVLLLLLCLIGMVLLLLGAGLSPWGANWLFEQAQSRGLVQAERFEGAPLDELTIEGLSLDVATLHLRVERFHLAWADDCLLKGRVCLDDLSVSGARIRLDESDSPPAESAPANEGGLPQIATPVPIEIRNVSLDDVEVALANGTRVRWDRFQTGATMSGDRLELSPTTLEGTRVRLPAVEPVDGQTALADVELGDGVVAPAAIQAAVNLNGEADADRSLVNGVATGATSTEASEAQPASPLSALTLAAAANVSGAPGRASSDPLVAEIESQLRTLQGQLPDFELPLEVDIPSLVVSDLELEGPTPQRLDRLEVSVAAVDRRVELRQLTLDAPDGHVELTARAELSGNVPLDLTLRGTIERVPLAGQRVAIDVSGSLADLDVALETSGVGEARITASLQAFEPGVPFALDAELGEWRWPLPQQSAAVLLGESALDATSIQSARAIQNVPSVADYRLDRLRLDAEGTLGAYQTTLEVAAQGDQLPPVELAVDGSGDLHHFQWQPLRLASEGGELQSQGIVRWTPTLSASLDLDVSQLPLEAFTDAVTGTLDGQARAAFAMREDGGWELALPRLAIDGRLQDRPLRLAARLDGNSDMQWNVHELDLRQGNNRVTANGRIDDRLNLDGRIDAPALETLLPALSGALRGTFQGRGTLERPQIALDLDGSDVGYGDNRVSRLALQANSTGAQDPEFDVDLDASGIAAANQRIERVGLDLAGRLSQHRLTLDVTGGEGLPVSQASLALAGGLDQTSQRYRGTLSSLAVGTNYGDIALRSPFDFNADLAGASASVSPFCLDRRQGGALCLTERMTASAAQGRAALALEDVPMALLDDFMPDGWRVDGETAGNVVASWSQGGSAWSATADLDSRAAITGIDARGAPWQVPEATLAMSLEANQQRASTRVDLNLEDAGDVRLEARIDDPAGAGTLGGRLQLTDLRFAPYQPLVAGIDELNGALNGDVALGGTLAMPSLDGNVRISDVSVRGGVSPVAITDAELDLALDGQTSTLDGYVQSEDGRLELDGGADWQDPAEWRANVDIDGTQSPLMVAMPAFGRLRVAPDIQVRAMPQRLQVRGDVTVPWARLEVGQLPASAQVPSSDTVIITEEEDRARDAAQAAEANADGADTAKALADAGMQLDVRVNLHLGPDVQLEAYGLETGLRGELEIRQGTGPVQLYGDVNLVGGTYTSFGQDLIIRQGQVLFSGPASQPSLRFEAIRNPDSTEDDVVAGLRVTGQAAAPRLTIFSEPAMTESRALSYILRGRAPEDDGGGDDALASALIGLSLSQTGSAVGRVGESFGVEDLSLDASGSGDDSQVVVSGYVFDDLKVSYGVGIFSPIAELTLRYRLIQNLYLQAVSGAAQAVDLIYTFSLGRTGGP
ncbi:translocation/assembly module TamB domain-containing protein [Salinicola halophilus]|uniref:autotransporter assembly complex protein TamB n=1 Tax=Salinicola halophilus TaxID=184065 RepID=UPI001EF847F9|nr:translocation/assembly module TamB domain-containing protein [Salinicola halophilus]